MVLVLSCEKANRLEQSQTDFSDLKNAFFPEYEHSYKKTDTLYLDVQIDNCGEWGGPRNEFKIYVDSENQYLMECRRYRFNCDSIGKYRQLYEKPLEYSRTFVLGSMHKKVVSAFFMNLMQAKISEHNGSNAGCIYWLHNNDSTLDIYVHTEQEKIEEDFYLFKKAFRLPENKKIRIEVPLEITSPQ